ncbi:hypothetical protein [Actinoplanes sp. OR16]|uniref:hypothetical protein n=1 Tax=Actinoplanes sp. OR16 TaxID=946334 RepID=UPI000FDB2A35|nr:hypothetical protein [Actinoplanes sp. OR16]
MSYEDDEYWAEEYDEYSFMPQSAVVQERHYSRRTAPDPVIPTRRTGGDNAHAKRSFDDQRPSWLDDPDFVPIDTSKPNLVGDDFADVDFNRPELGVDFDKPDFPIQDPAARPDLRRGASSDRYATRTPASPRSSPDSWDETPARRPLRREGRAVRDDRWDDDDLRLPPDGRTIELRSDEYWEDDRRRAADHDVIDFEARRRVREGERRDARRAPDLPEEPASYGRRPARQDEDVTRYDEDARRARVSEARPGDSRPGDPRHRPAARSGDPRDPRLADPRSGESRDSRLGDPRAGDQDERYDGRGRAWEDDDFSPIRPAGGRRPRRDDLETRGSGPIRREEADPRRVRRDDPAASGRPAAAEPDPYYDRREVAASYDRPDQRRHDRADQRRVTAEGRATVEARADVPALDGAVKDLLDGPTIGVRRPEGVRPEEQADARRQGEAHVPDESRRQDGVRADVPVRQDGVRADVPVRQDGVRADVPVRQDGVRADVPVRQDGSRNDDGRRVDDEATRQLDEERTRLLDDERTRQLAERDVRAEERAEGSGGDAGPGDGRGRADAEGPRVVRRAEAPTPPKVLSRATPPPVPRVIKADPPVAPRVVAAPAPVPPARVIGPSTPTEAPRPAAAAAEVARPAAPVSPEAGHVRAEQPAARPVQAEQTAAGPGRAEQTAAGQVRGEQPSSPVVSSYPPGSAGYEQPVSPVGPPAQATPSSPAGPAVPAAPSAAGRPTVPAPQFSGGAAGAQGIAGPPRGGGAPSVGGARSGAGAPGGAGDVDVPQQRSRKSPRTAHVVLSGGDGPWSIVPDEAHQAPAGSRPVSPAGWGRPQDAAGSAPAGAVPTAATAWPPPARPPVEAATGAAGTAEAAAGIPEQAGGGQAGSGQDGAGLPAAASAWPPVVRQGQGAWQAPVVAPQQVVGSHGGRPAVPAAAQPVPPGWQPPAGVQQDAGIPVQGGSVPGQGGGVPAASGGAGASIAAQSGALTDEGSATGGIPQQGGPERGEVGDRRVAVPLQPGPRDKNGEQRPAASPVSGAGDQQLAATPVSGAGDQQPAVAPVSGSGDRPVSGSPVGGGEREAVGQDHGRARAAEESRESSAAGVPENDAPYMDADGTWHNLKPIGKLAVSGPDVEPRRYADTAFGGGWFAAKTAAPEARQKEAGQKIAGQNEAGQNEAGPEEAGQNGAGQSKAGQKDAGQPDEETTSAPEGPPALAPHLPLTAADLSAIRWRLDGATLREVVDDREALRQLGERLDGPLADEADNIVKAGLLSVRAEVYRLLGELGMAAAASRLALAHAESAKDLQSIVIAQAELAHVLRLRGDFIEADRLFQRAVDADVPAAVRSVVHENAGRCCFDQGRLMEALDHFARAVRLGAPEDTDLVERIGVCLESVYIHVIRDGWGPYPRNGAEIEGVVKKGDAFDEDTQERPVVTPR